MEKIKEYIKNNKLVGYGLIAVVAVAVIVMAILFFPTQRSNRAVLKADKYLAAGEPEQAAKYYAKAVNITPTCTKAYYGLVYADLSFDHDKAVEDFEAARVIFAKYSARVLKKNANELIDAYNLVPELYSDYEDKIDALLECYAYTDSSAELHPALSDAYLEKARALKESDPEDSLEAYEETLNYRDSDEEIISELLETVKTVADNYRSYGDFEKSYALLDKYKDYLGEEYDTLYAEVKASEDLYEKKIETLSELYDKMEGYYTANHETFAETAVTEAVDTGLFTVDCEDLLYYDDVVLSLVQSFTDGKYIYSPDGFSGDFTGTACGIYTYGDMVTYADGSQNVSYYFYFGDYVDGKRSGYGYAFIKVDSSSYYAYEGEWADDAPNGFGVLYENDRYAYTSMDEYKIRTLGSFENGLANGEMTCYAGLNEQPDTYFYGTFTATAGVPTAIEWETENYMVDQTQYEGKTLFGVLQSKADGYDCFLPLINSGDTKVAVFGF